MQMPSEVDEQRFAGRNVALEFEAEHVERDRFARDRVFSTRHCFIATVDHRTNAIRIAECDEAVARNHRQHRVRAAAALMHATHRRENFLRRELHTLRGSLQLQREHVEQHLRVAVGVDVSRVDVEQLLLQRFAVGQIAVMRKRDAEWRVHIKRLRLVHAHGRTRSRISRVANPRRAVQFTHVSGTENIEHHAFGFVHVEYRAVGRHDARRVLTAMLQTEQAIVNQLIHRAVRNDSDHATHKLLLSAYAAAATNFIRFARSSGNLLRKIAATVANGIAVTLSRHQLICGKVVALATNTSNTTINAPRTTPNIMPSARSKNDRPMALTTLLNRNPARLNATNTPMNTSA